MMPNEAMKRKNPDIPGYHRLRMEMELAGTKPIPERVYGMFLSLGMEDELRGGILRQISLGREERLGKYACLKDADMFRKLFDVSVSYLMQSDGYVQNEWLFKAKIQELEIDGADRIPNSAFFDCPELHKVAVSDSVRKIFGFAFSRCANLREVLLPESLTEIRPFSFSSCASLEHMAIPDGVEYVGYGALAWCTSLREVTFPGSVRQIGENVTLNCMKLERVVIGSGIEKIGNGAFKDCPYLREVEFLGNTKNKVRTMKGYPWGVKDRFVFRFGS